MVEEQQDLQHIYTRPDRAPTGEVRRIPLVDPTFPDITKPVKDPTFMNALAQTVARRSIHGGLNDLDLTLLHSPPLTTGWNGFMGTIRTGLSIHPAMTEMIICRVAVLNQARAEWDQHVGLLKEGWREKASNLIADEAAVEAAVDEAVYLVRRVKPNIFLEVVQHPEGDGMYDDVIKRALRAHMTIADIAILAYTDALTLAANVSDEIWSILKPRMAESPGCDDPVTFNRTIVEITGTASAYNGVSRFLNALRLNEDGSWDTS